MQLYLTETRLLPRSVRELLPTPLVCKRLTQLKLLIAPEGAVLPLTDTIAVVLSPIVLVISFYVSLFFFLYCSTLALGVKVNF